MILLFQLTSDQNLEETGNKKRFSNNDQPVVKVISQEQEQKRD